MMILLMMMTMMMMMMMMMMIDEDDVAQIRFNQTVGSNTKCTEESLCVKLANIGSDKLDPQIRQASQACLALGILGILLLAIGVRLTVYHQLELTDDILTCFATNMKEGGPDII